MKNIQILSRIRIFIVKKIWKMLNKQTRGNIYLTIL